MWLAKPIEPYGIWGLAKPLGHCFFFFIILFCVVGFFLLRFYVIRVILLSDVLISYVGIFSTVKMTSRLGTSS